MLLQTNSYVVPKDKRSEHARLMRRFRQALAKLGCDMFEVYEQVGPNWSGDQSVPRYVQIMRFRDRKHQMAVQSAERSDPVAQALIAEFCELVNFQYQQQQGFFAVGFYNSVLPVAPVRVEAADEGDAGEAPADEAAIAESDQTEGGEAVEGIVEGEAPEGASAEEIVPEGTEVHEVGEVTPVTVERAGLENVAHDIEFADAPHEGVLHGEDSNGEIDDQAGEAEHAPADPEHFAAAGPPLEIDDLGEAATDEPPLSEEELLGELSPIHDGSDNHDHLPAGDLDEPAAEEHESAEGGHDAGWQPHGHAPERHRN